MTKLLSDINVSGNQITVNSSEDISSYIDSDTVHVVGELPLIVSTVTNNVITTKNPAAQNYNNVQAVIEKSSASWRQALTVTQENNTNWTTHFRPLMDFVSSSNEMVTLKDGLGNDVTAYSAHGLNAIAQSQGTAASKDVVTSLSDFTNDRLLKTGHGGYTIKPLDIPNNDIDALHYSGKYKGFSGLHPTYTAGDNPFPEHGGAFVLEVTGRLFESNDYTVQKATVIASLTKIKVRTYIASYGQWSEWHDILSDAYVNLHDFRGSGANQTIAIGEAVSATEYRAFLPLNNTKTPSSITVNGTFSVKTISGAVIANNLSNIVMGSRSYKGCMVNISGLSGLTTGQSYILQTESSSSLIRVNV